MIIGLPLFGKSRLFGTQATVKVSKRTLVADLPKNRAGLVSRVGPVSGV
jgi:hypothetical protein